MTQTKQQQTYNMIICEFNNDVIEIQSFINDNETNLITNIDVLNFLNINKLNYNAFDVYIDYNYDNYDIEYVMTINARIKLSQNFEKLFNINIDEIINIKFENVFKLNFESYNSLIKYINGYKEEIKLLN